MFFARRRHHHPLLKLLLVLLGVRWACGRRSCDRSEESREEFTRRRRLFRSKLRDAFSVWDREPAEPAPETPAAPEAPAAADTPETP
jgi:hypothetical protein